MEKKKIKIRGLHTSTAPRYTLGPLGLFTFGQRVELDVSVCKECRQPMDLGGCRDGAHPEAVEGPVRLVVLNIDHDGAGVAWDVEFLNELIDRRMTETGEDRKAAKAHVIKEKKRQRSCPHPAQYHANVERIQAMMDHQCAVNRERMELVA